MFALCEGAAQAHGGRLWRLKLLTYSVNAILPNEPIVHRVLRKGGSACRGRSWAHGSLSPMKARGEGGRQLQGHTRHSCRVPDRIIGWSLAFV